MAEYPTWPVSLPPPLIDGASWTAQNNIIGSKPDAGATRTRPRFTSVPEDVSYRILCSQAQVQVLKDFYRITLGFTGVFTWQDFNTGAPLAFYKFKSPPAFVPHRGGVKRYATLDLEQVNTTDGRFLLDVSDGTTGLTNT